MFWRRDAFILKQIKRAGMVHLMNLLRLFGAEQAKALFRRPIRVENGCCSPNDAGLDSEPGALLHLNKGDVTLSGSPIVPRVKFHASAAGEKKLAVLRRTNRFGHW